MTTLRGEASHSWTEMAGLAPEFFVLPSHRGQTQGTGRKDRCDRRLQGVHWRPFLLGDFCTQSEVLLLLTQLPEVVFREAQLNTILIPA